MEQLPTELLEKIFLLLRGPDRLRAALVCKRWAEIVSASRLLRDVCLVLRVPDLETATPTLLHNHRHYANLKIRGGWWSMDFRAAFWTRIAGDLISLQLEQCNISDVGGFYAILEQCQKLQSIEISDCGCGDNVGRLESKYPEKICVAKVQQSLRNVRKLSLPKNPDLTDASFNQMLTLMPNITSLCLARCGIQFPSGVFRALDTGTVEFSTASLSFQNVLVCMMRSKQKFVDLDFSDTLITDEALITIVELYRESLTSLRLDRCNELTANAYEAIGECTKLRLLSLHDTWRTNDDNLECILTKTPDLEYLDLGYCDRITSQSLERIVQLRKLRHLNLMDHRQIRTDSLGSLGALTELQHLDLSSTQCDAKAFRQLTSLKDLRTLKLRRCSNLDSECFVIICDNFERLEELDLDGAYTLTDEAGCKFHQLKNLRSLEISGAAGISDRSLENGIGAPDMISLGMGFCSLLTDRALLSIAKHHVCLEYLDLAGCERITDVGLISVVRSLPRLRTLILQSCRSLTNRSLYALQDHCPYLRKLDVMHCSMSDDAIDLLARLRPMVYIIAE